MIIFRNHPVKGKLSLFFSHHHYYYNYYYSDYEHLVAPGHEEQDTGGSRGGGGGYLVAFFLVRDPNFVAFGQAELGLFGHDSLGRRREEELVT